MHHTGQAKLENPDALTQFLAAEALSRARSLLFVARGDQFACTSGKEEDHVTRETWKNNPQFRLDLNKDASEEITWYCKLHAERGAMRVYESCAVLAPEERSTSRGWRKTLEVQA